MRVLVVEDEKKMAELLRRGLEEENHSVTVALDGHEALEAVAMADFDVIVLDVMLPGIDGFEVARRLRRAEKHTPILMLTARDAVQDIANGLDLARTITSPSRLPSPNYWHAYARWRAAVQRRALCTSRSAISCWIRLRARCFAALTRCV